MNVVRCEYVFTKGNRCQLPSDGHSLHVSHGVTERSATKEPTPDTCAIDSWNLSTDCTLRYTWDEPTGATKYTFVLEGTKYGKPFSVHMKREGVRQLLMKLAASL